MVERTLAANALLLSLIALVAGVSGADLQASGAPSQVVDLVVIEIVEQTVSIDVSVEGQPTVLVEWSASLTSPFGMLVEAIDVHMTPEHPSELSVGLSIYDFTLTPSEPTVQGTANLSAAPGTPADLDPVLILDAAASVQPRGNSAGVSSDSLNVVILPFYSAESNFVETAVTVKKGEKRTFVLDIENRGNAGGDFKVTVANLPELTGDGLEVTISDPTVNIAAGSSRKVDVVLKVKDDARVGGHTVLVKVTPAEERSGNVVGSALLTLDVREAYISAVQDILGRPLFLFGAVALAVVLLGLMVFGGLKLREHIVWKRTLSRIRSRNGGNDGRTKGA